MNNDITFYNLKKYDLLLERNPSTGEFEYNDFIRPADRCISEEKLEIRNNIANHGMDKQVESLVADFLKKHNTGYSGNTICARIGWNEELKTAILVDVGFC